VSTLNYSRLGFECKSLLKQPTAPSWLSPRDLATFGVATPALTEIRHQAEQQ